jgi:hypothetical protein
MHTPQSAISNLKSAIINHTETGPKDQVFDVEEKMFFTSIFCGSAVHIFDYTRADSSIIFFVASPRQLL